MLASVLVRGEQTLVGHILSSKPIVAAGTISYGIFLWHFPLSERLRETSWWSTAGETTALAVALGGALVLATASWSWSRSRRWPPRSGPPHLHSHFVATFSSTGDLVGFKQLTGDPVGCDPI